MDRPLLGNTLLYRGREGLRTMRAAIVTATVSSLDPLGVSAGHVPPLDDEQHVHLWVFTPSERGGFPEFNVPRGEFADGDIPPGSWCWPAELYG